MTALLARIAEEKRAIVLPLAVVMVANIVAYAFIVYPLGVKSTGAAERAQSAAIARQAAEREESLAQALVVGKAQADEELNAFYGKVLPASQTAARRMTYASLPALARRTNVRYEERRFSVESAPGANPNARLGRLVIRMVLQGEWDDIRDFIYQLESAPDFVIIDDVTLLESAGAQPLTLTIDLSTYFRQSANGT